MIAKNLEKRKDEVKKAIEKIEDEEYGVEKARALGRLDELYSIEEMLKEIIKEILLDLWTAHEDHTHSEIHNTPEIQAAYKGTVWYFEGQLLTCLNLLKKNSAIDVLGVERYEELREEWNAKKEELRKKLMFPFEENTEVTITFRSQ